MPTMAANKVQMSTVPAASPPRRPPIQWYISSYRSSAMPHRWSIAPMKMNMGTATSRNTSIAMYVRLARIGRPPHPQIGMMKRVATPPSANTSGSPRRSRKTRLPKRINVSHSGPRSSMRALPEGRCAGLEDRDARREGVVTPDDGQHVADQLGQGLKHEQEAADRHGGAQRIVDRLPVGHRRLADRPGVDRDLQRFPEQHAEEDEDE